ncbi:MAG: DMT family transporter [Candidatus Velthaea sp.]
MLASLVIDQFGLFGIPQLPANPARFAGVAFLIAAVVLIRR